jgi:hypothetical protein
MTLEQNAYPWDTVDAAVSRHPLIRSLRDLVNLEVSPVARQVALVIGTAPYLYPTCDGFVFATDERELCRQARVTVEELRAALRELDTWVAITTFGPPEYTEVSYLFILYDHDRTQNPDERSVASAAALANDLARASEDGLGGAAGVELLEIVRAATGGKSPRPPTYGSVRSILREVEGELTLRDLGTTPTARLLRSALYPIHHPDDPRGHKYARAAAWMV